MSTRWDVTDPYTPFRDEQFNGVFFFKVTSWLVAYPGIEPGVQLTDNSSLVLYFLYPKQSRDVQICVC